jgi:hypothetical protein
MCCCIIAALVNNTALLGRKTQEHNNTITIVLGIEEIILRGSNWWLPVLLPRLRRLHGAESGVDAVPGVPITKISM